MSVIIRLQGLSWSASAMDIRNFFKGLSIPPGGVHIIGGERGDAFIAFSTDEDARRAMLLNNSKLNDSPVMLFLSSKTEMQNTIIEAKEKSSATPQATAVQASASSSPAVNQMGQPTIAHIQGVGIQQSQIPQISQLSQFLTGLLPNANLASSVVSKLINQTSHQPFNQGQPPQFSQNQAPQQQYSQNEPRQQHFSQSQPLQQQFSQNQPAQQLFSQNQLQQQPFSQQQMSSQESLRESYQDMQEKALPGEYSAGSFEPRNMKMPNFMNHQGPNENYEMTLYAQGHPGPNERREMPPFGRGQPNTEFSNSTMFNSQEPFKHQSHDETQPFSSRFPSNESWQHWSTNANETPRPSENFRTRDQESHTEVNPKVEKVTAMPRKSRWSDQEGHVEHSWDSPKDIQNQNWNTRDMEGFGSGLEERKPDRVRDSSVLPPGSTSMSSMPLISSENRMNTQSSISSSSSAPVASSAAPLSSSEHRNIQASKSASNLSTPVSSSSAQFSLKNLGSNVTDSIVSSQNKSVGYIAKAQDPVNRNFQGSRNRRFNNEETGGETEVDEFGRVLRNKPDVNRTEEVQNNKKDKRDSRERSRDRDRSRYHDSPRRDRDRDRERDRDRDRRDRDRDRRDRDRDRRDRDRDRDRKNRDKDDDRRERRRDQDNRNSPNEINRKAKKRSLSPASRNESEFDKKLQTDKAQNVKTNELKSSVPLEFNERKSNTQESIPSKPAPLFPVLPPPGSGQGILGAAPPGFVSKEKDQEKCLDEKDQRHMHEFSIRDNIGPRSSQPVQGIDNSRRDELKQQEFSEFHEFGRRPINNRPEDQGLQNLGVPRPDIRGPPFNERPPIFDQNPSDIHGPSDFVKGPSNRRPLLDDPPIFNNRSFDAEPSERIGERLPRGPALLGDAPVNFPRRDKLAPWERENADLVNQMEFPPHMRGEPMGNRGPPEDLRGVPLDLDRGGPSHGDHDFMPNQFDGPPADRAGFRESPAPRGLLGEKPAFDNRGRPLLPQQFPDMVEIDPERHSREPEFTDKPLDENSEIRRPPLLKDPIFPGRPPVDHPDFMHMALHDHSDFMPGPPDDLAEFSRSPAQNMPPELQGGPFRNRGQDFPGKPLLRNPDERLPPDFRDGPRHRPRFDDRPPRPPDFREGPRPLLGGDERDGPRPVFREGDRDGPRPFHEDERRGPKPLFLEDERGGSRPHFRDDERGSHRPHFREDDRDGPRPPFSQDERDGPRPPFRQDERDGPRPPFRQDERDGPRPPFHQDERDDPRPPFRQDERDGPRPPFRQDERGGPRPAFRQDERGGPRTLFRQDERDGPRPFFREEERGGPRPLLSRDDRDGPRPLFHEDERGGPRPLFHEDERDGPRPLLSRDERTLGLPEKIQFEHHGWDVPPLTIQGSMQRSARDDRINTDQGRERVPFHIAGDKDSMRDSHRKESHRDSRTNNRSNSKTKNETDEKQKTDKKPDQQESKRKYGKLGDAAFFVRIDNLPLEFNHEDVADLFSDCAIPLKGIKMINDSKGKRLGKAFMGFLDSESLQLGLKKTGSKCGKRIVAVSEVSKKEFNNAVDSFDPGSDEEETDRDRSKKIDLCNTLTATLMNLKGNNQSFALPKQDRREVTETNKRKGEGDSKTKSENSKNSDTTTGDFVVKVGQLPEYANKQDIRHMFKDCDIADKGNAIVMGGWSGGVRQCIIEFINERSLQKAFKVRKVFRGNSLTISQSSKAEMKRLAQQNDGPREIGRPTRNDRNIKTDNRKDIMESEQINSSDTNENDLKWILITNLPYDFQYLDYHRLFEGHKIAPRGIQVCHDALGRTLGEGCIELVDHEEAKKALEKDGITIGRNKIRVELINKQQLIEQMRHARQSVRPELASQQQVFFFVKASNLPANVSTGEIINFFSGYNPAPESIRLNVADNDVRQNSSTALVGFRLRDDAERAVAEIHMKILRDKVVELSKVVL